MSILNVLEDNVSLHYLLVIIGVQSGVSPPTHFLDILLRPSQKIIISIDIRPPTPFDFLFTPVVMQPNHFKHRISFSPPHNDLQQQQQSNG